MTIAYDDAILERYIPIAYDELTERALQRLETMNDPQHRRFAALLRAYYHARFHHDLQDLKHLYQPFNPDADTLTLREFDAAGYARVEADFITKMEPLLNCANYEQLTESQLTAAMNQKSPYGVEVSVDYDDFDQMILFYRGEAHRHDHRRRWQSLYLKKESTRVDIYRRLFLLLKPKTVQERAKEMVAKEGGDPEKMIKKLRKRNPMLADGTADQRIYIKLFKDIPHADLEMLFPNSEVRISLPDKIKLGVTGGGGTIGGIVTLIGKLGAAIDPISFLIAFGGFGGVLWRQIKNIFTQRTQYMAALAKNLYFYNLDNNAGVLTYLIDMAEAEESKEALLTYLFLLAHDAPLDRETLDRKIEDFILEVFAFSMDIEIDDGVGKLLELGLVSEENGLLTALTMDAALIRLEAALDEVNGVL